MRTETWSRVSVEAYGYGRDWRGGESWSVLASKDGTAGNMYCVCLAQLYRDTDGEEYITPIDSKRFVGVDAYEEAAECYGFRC